MSDAHAGDRIQIAPNPNRVRVSFAGRVIADTRCALNLSEKGHAAVAYIPRADVDMSRLTRTQHKTRCPYKGEAAYYTVEVDGQRAENAVWTYEQPIASVAAIAGHLAFYRNRGVTMEETAD